MSLSTLTDLMEAEGSFPSKSVVLKSFETLLALGQDKKEQPVDLAWAFLLGFDQLSQVTDSFPPELANGLLHWVETSWSEEPELLLTRLCACLLNIGTPESLTFAQLKLNEATDEGTRTILATCVEQHPKFSQG